MMDQFKVSNNGDCVYLILEEDWNSNSNILVKILSRNGVLQ